ncbi:MAG: sigma-54-dependent transcriptional regulator [Dehalococcoidales bacterium]
MVSQKPSVLIVDDESVVCDFLCDELDEQGYKCATAFNGNDALGKLAMQDFDVVLLDIKLPGISGMEVLRELRLNHHHITVIMITGVNDVDVAVEAMKLGASDYIVKPFDLDRLHTSVRIALETRLAPGKSSTEMDAIARGVEAKLDPLFRYSRMVTQRTIGIARQLGIDEEEIHNWADAKARLNSEKNRQINSSLNKFRQSPLAQCLMGMTESYQPTSNPTDSQN